MKIDTEIDYLLVFPCLKPCLQFNYPAKDLTLRVKGGTNLGYIGQSQDCYGWQEVHMEHLPGMSEEVG